VWNRSGALVSGVAYNYFISKFCLSHYRSGEILFSFSCWLLPPIQPSCILTAYFFKATAQSRQRLANRVALAADPLAAKEPPSWGNFAGVGDGPLGKSKATVLPRE